MSTTIKSIRISVRLTNEEYTFLQELVKRTGKSKSEVIRQVLHSAMNDKTMFETKEHFILNKQLINEVNHIGNNINQIAKNNNSHYYTPYEKEKLFALMNELKKKLNT